MKSIVMLNVNYAESHIQALYAECHYAECRCNRCRGAILFKINIFQCNVMIQYLSNSHIGSQQEPDKITDI
jgi:hypothetical protein